MEAIDPHTVKFVFTQPTPYWLMTGGIIPRHIFEPYRGAKSREAPNNLKPVGTGPYRFVDFKPGDLLKAEINPNYHVPNRPFFDTLEVKGGGDAVSAARAVLQTGEYDYAAGIAGVDDEVLQRLEQGGKGKVAIAFGGRITHVQLNQSDPWTEVDGERSSVKTVHPFLTDPAVQGALALLVDRAGIQEQILGRMGQVTPNFINSPERFRSKNIRWEFSIDKANQLLDAGGWKRGADGVRAKDGKRLKMVFQTVTNAAAQKIQAVIKQAAAKAGIEMELKAVSPSSFYSSDPANPDTYTHFYADLQLMTYVMGPPDPERLMRVFTSSDVAHKENNWQRFNVWRCRNEEYDRLYPAGRDRDGPGQARGALHPDERPRGPGRHRRPDRAHRQGVGGVESAAGNRSQPLRGRLLVPALLVPRGMTPGIPTAEPRRAGSRPPPARAVVLAVLHEPRFIDLTPAEIYATMLDEGQYLLRAHDIRVLAAHHEVSERRPQLRHPH